MRIALITGALPFGGTTTFTLFLGAGLRQLGIPVEVFSFASVHAMADEFTRLGIPVYRGDERRMIFEDRLRELYHRLRTFTPTAVFAVLGSESFEMLRYVPAGVLRVGMLHDHLPPVYEAVRIYRDDMDHLAVVSQSIAKHVAQRFPGLPCTYLQHGVIFYDAAVARTANPDRPLKILFFGRLDQEHKQVRLFPDIYRALKQRGFPFTWTIHGEGQEKNFLTEHLVEGVAAGEIRFSAPVRHDELPALIAAHDIYLLTSAHEGGPLSLIEAMGRGLVPVCGDIPCLVQEMITPENGFRVARADPAAYADAIERLHRDRAWLERLSAAARQTAASGFSEVAMARRYVEFVKARQPAAAAAWPEKIRIAQMRGPRSLASHPALRPLRRAGKKLMA